VRTQPVTETDLQNGRIRFPKEAKALFPSEAGAVGVVLRGRVLQGRYNPRTSGDKERSATLSLGKSILPELVAEGDILHLEPIPAPSVLIN
jgi:hypothetical protein